MLPPEYMASIGPISVSKWCSKDHLKFEIRNNVKEIQVCEWSAKSVEVPFFSLPGPFSVSPGETKLLLFKQCVDQSQPEEWKKVCYTVQFKLTSNNMTIFEDNLVCSYYCKSSFDVYLTSHVLP
jgi:hypothetical protein